MTNVYTITVNEKEPEKVNEEIIKGLIDISDDDNDFDENNQNDVVAIVKSECHTPEEIIERFLNEWLFEDMSVDGDYAYKIAKNSDNEIVSVAIVIMRYEEERNF